MSPIMIDFPGRLLDFHEPPCLSLYQPTHRHRPENQQDLIRFRNLVKTLEESLHQKYPKREVETTVGAICGLGCRCRLLESHP